MIFLLKIVFLKEKMINRKNKTKIKQKILK